MKVLTFIMGDPAEKKHSTRFDFVAAVPDGMGGADGEPLPDKFKPSFYIPKGTFVDRAKRIRVTIEEVE